MFKQIVFTILAFIVIYFGVDCINYLRKETFSISDLLFGIVGIYILHPAIITWRGYFISFWNNFFAKNKT